MFVSQMILFIFSYHFSHNDSGHSRARMSSMSNALDSIVSCSEDEDEATCSSDEETGSYYSEQHEQNNHRVWKYGEPPTTNATIDSKKKPSHDRLMERERLLQEEYEFRLHKLKRENERLAKKFRLFVLVTVAFILVAALAFAFVVCIRMLLS